MRSMRRFAQFLTLFMVAVLSAHAVPAVLNYAGQVAVNGQAFDGQGLFKFALVNADGNVSYWSNDGTSANGSEPAVHVGIAVNGGLYSLLLGNTAMSDMGAIDPAVFAQHTDAKLRVWFSDGVNGFQQLSPDRPFASVPYAFSAGTAQSAGSANIANGSVSLDMLSQDVKSQINAPIGLNRLSAEVTAKLDQNGSGASGVVAGSLISVSYGQSAPAGYSLYQQGTPKELVWEEKAPVSVGRYAYDGIELVNDKIYFVGGNNGTDLSIAERYDPAIDQWVSISSLSVAKHGVATASLDEKLFVIGGFNYENGANFKEVEVFNPSSSQWSSSSELPIATRLAAAITFHDKIYLIGGRHDNNSRMNQVVEYSDSLSLWETKATMPTARNSLKLVVYKDKIWAIGGFADSATQVVESYDPVNNVWSTEASLTTPRLSCSAWVSNGYIFVAGGSSDGSDRLNTIEYYDPIGEEWKLFGNLPENKTNAGAVTLKNKVFLISGSTASNTYSNKVYAADLNASVAGVYDLYRKDGNASAGTPLVQAEVADGSVTTAKIASNTITTSDLSEQILKYLRPEITAQPQPQTVYADSNVSYSVSAEGKYLSYQWKKDGVDLAGETNATLNITAAEAIQHDGNYSVVVSNDFGSVESALVEVLLSTWSPLAISNLKLWLDASDLTTAELTWTDKSGNGNHATKHNTPTVITSFQNGLSIMRYDESTNAASTDYHEWNDINDIRTVFAVFKRDSGNKGAILTDDSRYDFYTPTGTLLYAESHSYVKNGLYKINGTSITAISTNYPASLSIAAIRSTGNVEASRIGRDRSVNRNHFDGDYGELLIYNSALSDSKISKVEGYLAHKWGLTADLPSNHTYKNNAP